jgi:hypothetical protein
MQRILHRATLIASAFALLVVIDVAIIYPLNIFGFLDGPATVYNIAAFVICIPGYVVGALVDLNSESFRDLTFLVSGPIFTSAMVWIGAVALLWLKQRWTRRSHPEAEEDLTEGKPVPEAPVGDLLDRGGVGRRRFIIGALGTTAVGCSLPALYSMYYEPRWPRFTRLDFTVRDLPEALEGLRLVQLSDLHLGPYVSGAYLASVVDRCNELRPDVVALTGDYVFSSPRFIPRVVDLITRLRPRLGMVGVLGNHDCFEDAPATRAAFTNKGIPLVDNSRIWLTAEGFRDDDPGDGALCLAGVADLWAEHPDLDAALDGVRPGAPRLLLCHNPDFAETEDASAGRHRVDLMLSGHTHGGQVSLPSRGVVFASSSYGLKYASGLVAGPAFPVYVCCGVGVGSLPLRYGVRPEVTLIELRSDGSRAWHHG